MADKTFKVNPGDEIIITVPARASANDILMRRPPKAMIRARRADEHLPRRLSGNFINFYDLGQISDGSGGWLPSAIQYLPPTVTDFYRQFSAANINPDTATVNALINALNAPLADEANWTSRYRRLDYTGAVSYRCGVGLNTDDATLLDDTREDWRPGGLLPRDFTKLSVQKMNVGGKYVFYDRAGAFNSFATGETTVRVTAEPSFDAPIVPLNIAAGAVNVFLNPALLAYNAYHSELVSHTYTPGTNAFDPLRWLSVWQSFDESGNRQPCAAPLFDRCGEPFNDGVSFLRRIARGIRTDTSENEFDEDFLNYLVGYWTRDLIFDDELKIERDTEGAALADTPAAMKRFHLARARHSATLGSAAYTTDFEMPGQDPPEPLDCFGFCGPPKPDDVETLERAESAESVSAFDTSGATVEAIPINVNKSLLAVVAGKDYRCYIWRANGGIGPGGIGGGDESGGGET